MNVTHLVNFGFGQIAVEQVANKFKVLKSDDAMMPVGIYFPVKDTEILEADVVQLN